MVHTHVCYRNNIFKVTVLAAYVQRLPTYHNVRSCALLMNLEFKRNLDNDKINISRLAALLPMQAEMSRLFTPSLSVVMTTIVHLLHAHVLVHQGATKVSV